MLPGSLQEEDEGTVTQVEGRIIKVNKAVDCPGDAREDWRIIQDIAAALGRPKGFTFTEPRDIFEELRIASKGGVADYRQPVDDASEEYPIFLTTGRVVSQFLSGTQTRRIGPLVKQYPEPRLEMHPRLAAKLGIGDGEWATAETRRGAITLRAMVVTTIRPDTIFIPYHWAGKKSANQLTVAAQDPISKIPQYKVCACRVRKADGAPDYAATLEPQQ